MIKPAVPPEMFGLDVAYEARRIHRCFGTDAPSYIGDWRHTCRDDDHMLEVLTAIEAVVIRLTAGA